MSDSGFILGPGSKANMEGLHPSLKAVVSLAITLSEVDFSVVEGVRSKEQCYINFGKGRTQVQCALAGCPTKYAKPKLRKVTLVGHPLSSNHAAKRDGFGHAVDIWPYPLNLVAGKKPEETYELFDEIAEAMFEAAKRLKVTICWGANWDMDSRPRERGEWDNPHFELA